MENMFDLPRGCRQCGECYTLIQQRVNDHRAKLLVLDELLKEIMEHPVTVNDTNFDNQLEQVKKTIGELAMDVTNSLGGSGEICPVPTFFLQTKMTPTWSVKLASCGRI
jgi:hypothetical protein